MNEVRPRDGTIAREDGTGLPRELRTLPVFLALAGRRVILAGSSAALLWKARLFRATGARLEIYGSEPDPEIAALEPFPSVTLVRRPLDPADLIGASLAVIEAESSEKAATFHAAARAAGVPINVIDRPDFCDFQFGAIIDRSPLVIGISTGGAAPALAQALRGRLQAQLPRSLSLWAKAAEAWRAKLRTIDVGGSVRRRFWEVVSRRALDPSANGPGEADFPAMLREASTTAQKDAKGSVWLVGAGPGDPELLTLKALRILQSADTILYDDLVSPAVIEMARREAQKIRVGKRGYRPSCRQDEIVKLLVSLALEGKRVVRLKGGDPMIFGRANEEIAGLAAAGIPVEVVPGVTAALGAAAALRVSLTERDRARRLQFITAHAHDGRLPDDIDWRALCDPKASSVVYMGAKTLGTLSDRLLAHGIDPTTPAVLVEHATWPDEQMIAGTIETLPREVAARDPSGPCIIFFGPAFGAVIEATRAETEVTRQG